MTKAKLSASLLLALILGAVLTWPFMLWQQPKAPPATVELHAEPVRALAPEPADVPQDADLVGPVLAPNMWEHLDPPDWAATLPGEWVGVDGDAVNGGHLVKGGARVEFTKGRKDSKTPWNIKFITPTAERPDMDRAAGGCGFYDTGTAYCRGAKDEAPTPALITLSWRDADDTLRVAVTGLFTVELRRK